MRPNFIVGIGGSAGGLPAYTALLDALPPTTGMAFIIISHMMPSAPSQLARILSRHTKMPVEKVSASMPLRANHVYVMTPDTDLLVDGDALKVVAPRVTRNTQVDVFLSSLADAVGERAIGVILSGYDGDGTAGCKHIKARGGIVITQDESAAVPHMPSSARAAGASDFILPPAGIALELQRIAKRAKARPSA